MVICSAINAIFLYLLFQIIDSPLDEQWNVDLNGKLAFTVMFKMDGKTEKLYGNGAESFGHANFGGRCYDKYTS